MAHLKKKIRLLTGGLMVLLLIGNPSWGAIIFPTAVTIDQSLYFQKPGGEPAHLMPGVYEVEQGGEERLTLNAVGTKTPFSVQIQALPAGHDQDLDEPTADLLSSPDGNSDKRHLLLSLPNGLALEAVGSVSGVFTRSAMTWSTRFTDRDSTDAPLTLHIEESIYFKTVGGDPKAIQPGNYEVTTSESGLILTPVDETEGQALHIETESLGTSAAVMLPEFDDNPDLELLMLGTAGGRSYVAIGSHSGTFPRGFFKKLGRGLKKVGGKIKKGAHRVGSGVKKTGQGIKRGARFAHGKVKRHVVPHVKKGVRVGLRHAKKYGRKVAAGAYKVTKKVGKEVVKFCTGSVSAAHTCYKVGKMAVVAAAS